METMILGQLLTNATFARKVICFIDVEYFSDQSHRVIFEAIDTFWDRYSTAPTRDALAIEVENRTDISDAVYNAAIETIEDDLIDESPDLDWLIEKTEAWCQERAIHNAISASISIIDGDDKKRTAHAIPEILKEALAVGFTVDIGHNYIQDAEKRYDHYHEEFERIPFDLGYFNQITNGGIPKGTLNVLLAGTNVGKTFSMIHFAASYLKRGLNVMYITLEMAEEEIARRIDANIFETDINAVESLSRDYFTKGIKSLRQKTTGDLIIKQFPTGSAHVGHFRQALNELKLKKGFTPDIILVDYIGICASSRMKMGTQSSYYYVKAIAEELRGLAIEYDVPLWTAVQSNRNGFDSTDVELTDTAESFGLPATADFMAALIRTPEFDEMGQIKVKQLKNRYGSKDNPSAFSVGIKFTQNRLFDLDDSAQSNHKAGAQKKGKFADEKYERALKREPKRKRGNLDDFE